jgi:magnesium transporter
MRLATLLKPDLERVICETPEQIVELVRDLHPADVAEIFQELDTEDLCRALAVLPARDAALAFERLDERDQMRAVRDMTDDALVEIVSCMEPDRRARFVRVSGDRGKDVLASLRAAHPVAAREVETLEKWPEHSAGRLMTTSFVALPHGSSVGEALDAIGKHAADRNEPIYAVYAVDAAGKLLAFARLREVAPLARERPMADVWRTRFASVPPTADEREVARVMGKYDLAALPVVDEDRIVGIITIDDVVDVLNELAGQSIERAGAVEPLDVPYFKTSFVDFLRKRGVWLLVLFVEEFFTQTALRHYDPVFEAIHGASYYVPLLISTGGNSGSQSATLVIRGLSVGEIEPRHWLRILGREIMLGVALGAFLGAIGFARVLMYHDQGVHFALTIALTLVGIVVVGCSIGSMLPLVLRRVGFDPATSSTPFIASLVDVVGIIVFVHVAKIVMADVIAHAAMAR